MNDSLVADLKAADNTDETIAPRRTEVLYLDLEALTVDGRILDLASATLTIETVSTKGDEGWMSDEPRWFGQIVSDSCTVDARNFHSLRARSSVGLTVSGRFLVDRCNRRGIDFIGSGGLTVI